MSIKKELLLLSRDIGGIVILFVMPMLLLVAVTMVQSGSFDSLLGTRMQVLLVDHDQDSISLRIKQSFAKDGSLELISQLGGKPISESEAKALVHQGAYQLAIVLPKDLSKDLNVHVKQNVDKILAEFDFSGDTTRRIAVAPVAAKEIKLYFDPATQAAFKTAVKMSIDKLVSNIETQTIYSTFQSELGEQQDNNFTEQQFISFKEVDDNENGKTVIPNAAQHNVPAWALFAIFFIVVPLSINIVKEKSQGTMVRISTSPTSYATFLLGKTVGYLIVSLIQFYLMLLVGVYLFPYLGLHQFQVQGYFPLLSLIAIFSGLAAIGLGILIGTIASTQEQSAPFGATLTVVLAAFGGVWVPVFLMPNIMQKLSVLSPMNWGLSAFYDVLLRHAGLTAILPAIILLFLFFILTLSIAIIYDKKKKTI
ncbi:ABC transporter permease [Sphingobacterium bambusae]|uniref:ABC transporter permease n=2 Tax=Sphingobacterium bambusae TaxID=662858 RepID=A0ABW6BGX1_9SPHI|nr:ABC transporter permease [Sphingobacterium bambusae]WPL50766.1 ABC transporter permease [Sphingobacterium bambusae]